MTSPLRRAWRSMSRSSPKAATGSRMARASKPLPTRRRAPLRMQTPDAATATVVPQVPAAATVSAVDRPAQERRARRSDVRADQNARGYEPITSLHRASGRDFAVDAGDRARRHGRFQIFAALGAAAGRLSDDSSADALSGSQSRGDEQHGDGAARRSVRPDVRTRPHELDERGGRVGDHAAVLAELVARCGRTRSAGGDQRERLAAARRFARAAGVREGESGRRAGAHARGQLRQHAAHAGAEPGQSATRAEDQSGLGRWTGHAVRGTATGDAHSSRHAGAGVIRHRPGYVAHRHQPGQRERGERQLRRAKARLHHQLQRSAPHRR